MGAGWPRRKYRLLSSLQRMRLLSALLQAQLIRQEYDAGDGQVCQCGVLGHRREDVDQVLKGHQNSRFWKPHRSGRGGNVAVGNSPLPWHGLQIPRYTFGMPLELALQMSSTVAGLVLCHLGFLHTLKAFSVLLPLWQGRAFVSTPMVAGVVGPTLRCLAGMHASDSSAL